MNRTTTHPGDVLKEELEARGTNPELLINMQTRYNMSVARHKEPLLARLIDIKRTCAAVL